MRRTNIYLPERLCTQLDRRARADGVSRAEVIRRLLDEALAGRGADLERDLEALDRSFAVLAGVAVDLERAEDDRMRHLDAVKHR